MKNLMWYLIAGTKGGETRGKIIEFLSKNPSNANKLAEILHMDYKTIRHHLKVLEKNNIITAVNKGNYGAVYFLSEIMKSNMSVFNGILKEYNR